MSLPRVPSASIPVPAPIQGADERYPAADPWQGWAGILGVSIFVLLFQVGCSAINPTPALTGLGKNLVGRWERTGGTPETLIFNADGTFIQLRGRTEKLAKEVDGWTFSTPGGKGWDVMIAAGSSAVGGFKCEFRDDDEIEIVDGTGLKTNLKGTYRRVGGATSDGPPPKPGSMAEKLLELKTHLATSEKRREELKKARIGLEKQRLDKKAEMRRAGIAPGIDTAKLTNTQKELIKDLAELENEDTQLKKKVEEIEGTMSKFRTVITKLNVKLVVEGNEPTGDDLTQIDAATVALRMAQEDLKRDAPPMVDSSVEDFLKEQLGPKDNGVEKKD